MTQALGEAIAAVAADAGDELIDARKLLDKGEYDGAAKAAQDARTAFEASGDTENLDKANLLFLQARSQQDGGWEEVQGLIPSYALPIAEQLGDESSMAQLLLLQAQAGLAVFEKHKNKIPEDQREVFAAKAHDESRGPAMQALTLSRKIHDEVNTANALYLMAQTYNLNKSTDDAVRFGKQAAGIFKGLKDFRMCAAANLTIAEGYRVKGKSEDAWRACKEAVSMAQRSGDRLIMEGAMNFSAQLELATRATYTTDEGKTEYVPYIEKHHAIAYCTRYAKK